MNIDKLCRYILDEYDGIIYVADIETYELIYLNKGTLKLFHNILDNKDYLGKKCYQILQGLDKPCSFCNNSKINCDNFYCWEHYNTVLDKYFFIKDKKIIIDGKEYRLEIANDFTGKELEKQQLQNALSNEKSLVECIQKLTITNNNEENINALLRKVCELYNGERGYIFEFNSINKTFSNTYEWCKESIRSEKDNLQNLPASGMQRWIEKFQKDGDLYMESLEESVTPDSFEYEILKPQGIKSIIAVPLMNHGSIIGFIGIDNPKSKLDDTAFLKSLALFVSNNIEKGKILEELEWMSTIDVLTKVFNRNQYIHMIKELKNQSFHSLGIIYMDLNGLKKLNDSYGHIYGDVIIKKAAQIMCLVFPERVYRIGGDEFIILDINTEKEEFKLNVKKLKELFQKEPSFSISIGVQWINASQNIENAIEDADKKMYHEKQLYHKSLEDKTVYND